MGTTIVKRLERAEAALKKKGLGQQLTNCICFPDAGSSPFFLYPGIRELAFRLKCSLHGDRFRAAPAGPPKITLRELTLKSAGPGGMRVNNIARHGMRRFRNEWPTEEISVEGRIWRLPHSAEGELLDWKNVSSAPPWKRVHARTLGDDMRRNDEELQEKAKPTARRAQRTRNLEAEQLLEQWGIKES